MIGHQRSIALRNAEDAQRNAANADDNFQLALAALEETLAESVVGELIVEPIDEKRSELQRRGIDFYNRLAEKNGVEPTTWAAYRLLVFNQRVGEAMALQKDNPMAAEMAWLDAIHLAEKLTAATDGDPKNQSKLISCIDDYGAFLTKNDRRDQAIEQSLRAEQLIGRLKHDHPGFPLTPYLEGKNLYNRSVCQQDAGRMDEAERLCSLALSCLERVLQDLDDVYTARTLATCQYNLGFYLAQRGEDDEAKGIWQKARNTW